MGEEGSLLNLFGIYIYEMRKLVRNNSTLDADKSEMFVVFKIRVSRTSPILLWRWMKEMIGTFL